MASAAKRQNESSVPSTSKLNTLFDNYKGAYIIDPQWWSQVLQVSLMARWRWGWYYYGWNNAALWRSGYKRRRGLCAIRTCIRIEVTKDGWMEQEGMDRRLEVFEVSGLTISTMHAVRELLTPMLLSCDSVPAMKAAVGRLRDKLGSDPAYFLKVYSHTFDFARAPGQRSLRRFQIRFAVNNAS